MSTLPRENVARTVRGYHTWFLEMNFRTGIPEPDFSGLTTPIKAAVLGHLKGMHENRRQINQARPAQAFPRHPETALSRLGN